MCTGKDKVHMPCTILGKMVARKRKYLQKCRMLEESPTTTTKQKQHSHPLVAAVILQSAHAFYQQHQLIQSTHPLVALALVLQFWLVKYQLSTQRAYCLQKIALPTNVSVKSDVEVTKVAATVDFSNATMTDVVLSDEAVIARFQGRTI